MPGFLVSNKKTDVDLRNIFDDKPRLFTSQP